MGKDSEKIDEILETIKGIQNQLNFMQVQLGSAGTSGRGAAPTTGRIESRSGSAIDQKVIQNLERTNQEILAQLAAHTEQIALLNDSISKLASAKVEQAEERMNQVTRLLEKGLQLTEMGAQLTEIKDRLEEVLVELATAAKSNEILKGISEEQS